MIRLIYRLWIVLLALLMPCLGLAFEGDVSAIVNSSGGDLSNASTIGKSLFDPNLTDLSDVSINLLGKLFGPVGDVLAADHAQLLGGLLYIFNQGIWVVAGLIVSFVVLTTVIHTSKEGELMGQRSHMLTLYKAVFGMGLLIPKAGGYSIIQIIVMWVVLQGVHLADGIWTTAIRYLSGGGVVAANVSPDRYARAVPLVTQVLKSEVCMYLMQAHDQKLKTQAQKLLKDWSITHPNNTANDQITYNVQSCLANASTNYIPDYTSHLNQVSFGTRPSSCGDMNTQGMCGVYDWSTKPTKTQPYIALGMTQLVTGLLPVARKIAENAWASAAIEDAAYPDKPKSPGPLPDTCLLSTNPADCGPVSFMQAAAIDYVNTLQPLANTSAADPVDRLGQAIQYGWVVAAVYYRDIVQQMGESSTDSTYLSDNELVTMNQSTHMPILVSNPNAPKDNPSSMLKTDENSNITGNTGYFVTGSHAYNRPIELAFQAIDDPISNDYTKQTLLAFDQMVDAWNAASNNSYAQFNAQIEKDNPFVTGGDFSDTFPNMDYLVKGDVKKMVTTLWKAWKHLTVPTQQGFQVRDMITALSAFGVELMHATLTFWTEVTGHIWQEVVGIASGFVIAMGVISAGAGWVEDLGAWIVRVLYNQYLVPINFIIPPGIPFVGAVVFYPIALLGGGIQNIGFVLFQATAGLVLLFKVTITIIFWYLPIFLYVGVPIFITGVLLGVYAPLIPYLLFMFGVFGWFIAVIEAMVAGPLIALGVTHPTGQHDYLGRAEQAIVLLLNIMLRPAAMVIGLLAGTLLSFVSLELLNVGFSAVFNEGLLALAAKGPNLGGLGRFTVVMAFIALYTTTALILINRCFSMIYVVPDKLCRWLGAQPEHSMPDSVLEHIKGGMTRSVQSVASSQAQTATEMTKSASPPAMGIMTKLGKRHGEKK